MTATNLDTLRTIIDFAIQKEQEAVDFYTDIAGKVRLKSVAEELLKFAVMEKGHRDKLQRLDLDGFATKATPEVANLKIADYLVEAKPHDTMTWQDIVHIAMQRELASLTLYTNLAGMVADPAVKQLLENLAAEEAGHKLYFERIWDEDILTEN